MHIAIVTPYADPEKGAAVVRVNSFRDFFQKKGHRVTVFAPVRAPPVAGVVRYPNMYSLFSFIREAKPDVVIGTSPPITHNVASLFSSASLGVPFVLDAKDPFTYLVSRFSHLRKGRGKMLAYRAMEWIVHKGSSHIFVLTPRDKILLRKWYSLSEKKISVIWNGSNPSIIRPDKIAGRKTRKEMGIPSSSFVVVYAGVLGGKELDIFFKQSVVQDKNIHFILLFTHDGSSHTNALESELLAATREYADRIHIVKNIPYHDLCRYLSAADIALNPVPSFWETCLPTKTFDYLAAGLPLLAKGPDEGSLRDFCEQFDVGWFSTTWVELSEKLRYAKKNKKMCTTKGLFGRKIIEKEFDRRRFNSIALSVLEEL